MNHDLGGPLPRRMGVKIEYRALPRKRMVDALAQGEGDVACTYQPPWLPGPFFRPAEVVASRQDAARVRRLEDLREWRVGTVLDIVYLELARSAPRRAQAQARKRSFKRRNTQPNTGTRSHSSSAASQ